MFKRLFLASTFLFLTVAMWAQGGHMPPPPPGSDNPAPLGFTELLIGAGAAYGARQLRRKNRRTKG